MNPAHLHLLLNHLPIVGTYVALPLLALAFARREERSALYAVVLVLLLAAGGAVAANLTGDPAEERVEDLPGVSKHWIDEHSERADVATGIAVFTGLGAIGLLAWTIRRGTTPIGGLATLSVLAMVSAGAMAYTGIAGGQIHHGELRAPGDNTSNAAARSGSDGARHRGRAAGGGGEAGRPARRRRPAGDEAGEPTR